MQKRPDLVPETGKSAQKQQEGRESWLFWVETGTVFAAAPTEACFSSLLERAASLPVPGSQFLRSVSLCSCRIQEVRSGKAHPVDLRRRVIAFVEEEYEHREAARRSRVSPRFVHDMVILKRESGGLLPKAQGNHAEGKVALISGRATGLGGAASTLFAADGAAVAIVDRNLDQAQARAAEITAAGGAITIAADVPDAGQVSAAVPQAAGRSRTWPDHRALQPHGHHRDQTVSGHDRRWIGTGCMPSRSNRCS